MSPSNADIITRAKADITDFVRPIETGLTVAERGFRNFSKTVDTSMVQVSTSTTQAAKDVQRELAGIANAHAAAGRQINQNRAGIQQLGFQLSDVAAQAANGTSALTIFAQQSGQVAFALSQFGGTVGAVGRTLSGPLGVGLTVAALAVGALATAANEAGGAGEELADKYGEAGIRIRDTFIAPVGEAARTVSNLVSDALSDLADNTVRELDFAAQKVDEFADFVQRTNGLIPRLLQGGPALLESRLEAVRQAQARELAGRRADQRLAGTAANRAFGFDRSTGEFELAGGSPAATRAAIRSAQSAQAEAQRQLREAEAARERALLKELELIEAQGAKVRDLADITARLEGGFSDRFDQGIAGLRSRFPTGSSVFDAGGSAELKGIVDRNLAEAGFGAREVAREFRQEGLIAAQAIAQAFGGQVGGQVNRIAGTLRGLATGDFTSVGGPIGGAATLIARDPQTRRALEDSFKPVADQFSKVLDEVGSSLGLSGGQLGGSLVAGFGIGGAIGGNTESAVGGAVGSAAGSALGMAVGGPIGAAIGSVLGSVVGSGIGGLFAGPKKGSATITASGGEFAVGPATGNSASRRAAASSIGGSVADSLNRIASTLGADIGSFAVSVGQRDGVFSVDPTGRGFVSRRFGAQQFSSAEEAARFAIRDAINDGAFTGISQTVVRAITNASTLEKGLDDAVAIQSIGRRLREIEDPIGSAFDELRKQFDDLRDTLRDAGGTVEELAELEKLYATERERLTTQSVATLQGFLSSLQVGGNSPLSLTDQRRNAELAFSRFESDIRAGRAIDQSAFVSAGQNLLDVERQISGGTAGFFDTFNRVQGATTAAIGGVQNATAIREAELAAAAKNTADSTAALVNIGLEQNQLLANLSQQLAQAGFGGFVGADAAGRSFIRSAA